MAQHVAGLGAVVSSRANGDRLVAYGLGSCVGLVLHDPRTGTYTLAHVVLPGPRPAGSDERGPVYYADPGVARSLALFREIAGPGTSPVVSLFGGAAAVGGLTAFDIGRRNVLAVRRALWQQGLTPAEEDVEGNSSRTVAIDVGRGRVQVSLSSVSGDPVPVRGAK